MGRRRAWVLNLDAEDELANPAGATPSRATRARIAELVPRLMGTLVPEGDLVLAEDEPSPDARATLDDVGACVGYAWCPTPRARRAWRRARVTLPDVPDVATIRAVNHRRFCASLGQTLPGAAYATSRAELDAALASGRSPTGAWLLKRPFGYAGRGRRAVRAGALDLGDLAWIAASLAAGEGLQVEPYVVRDLDAAIHGFVARGGRVVLGVPTVQRVDERGAWLETLRDERADLLSVGERAALLREGERVGSALAGQGYHGPFGVDAFRWRDEGGRGRFRPRSEVNARYSMGWAAGMGALRPDL